MFPKIGVPQNEWFIMESPIKMDDLGVPLFLETSMLKCIEVEDSKILVSVRDVCVCFMLPMSIEAWLEYI